MSLSPLEVVKCVSFFVGLLSNRFVVDGLVAKDLLVKIYFPFFLSSVMIFSSLCE